MNVDEKCIAQDKLLRGDILRACNKCCYYLSWIDLGDMGAKIL